MISEEKNINKSVQTPDSFKYNRIFNRLPLSNVLFFIWKTVVTLFLFSFGYRSFLFNPKLNVHEFMNLFYHQS